MRLWHKDLIPVLPRQQLLGQWRECCCIARNIAEKGTPNHLLVNKIMDYPLNHFNYFGSLIICEMARRGYFVNHDNFNKWIRNENGTLPYPYPEYNELFEGWHNERYLLQCYHNLQEKYDCGGISETEWNHIAVKVITTIYPDAIRRIEE